ncbi:MAG: tetratricopeptide repeat protein [Planctomycetota bacterium]
MVDRDSKPDAAAEGDSPREPVLVRLRNWTAGNPVRSALIGSGLMLLAIGTIVTWVTLASLAAPRHVATLAETLEALDAGDDALARLRANRLQAEPDRLAAGEFGGPLYVLGVIKSREADDQPLPERAHDLYLLASRYLAEARKLGVPDERDVDSLYQLGRALTMSGEYADGIEALDEALLNDPGHAGEIHLLLGEAHFYDAEPDSAEVLEHFDQALASDGLSDAERGSANLRKALTLGRLKRFDDAVAVLEAGAPLINPGDFWYAAAQLRVQAVEADGRAAGTGGPLVQAAEKAIAEARRADKLATRVTAGATYLLGRLRESQNRIGDALELYSDVRRNAGASPEGIAASLAEADLLRAEQRIDESLEAYRRTAVAVKDEAHYRSDVLPLGELHNRILAAKASLTAAGQFAAALSLVEHLAGLFDYSKRLELRAIALQTWGDHLLDQAEQERRANPALVREGRHRLREAGMTFQRLAEVRYATEDYTEDLWRAAEAYFHGHGFTDAADVLVEYLKEEPRRRNAVALQRLGQSYLSLGQPAGAVTVFEECVEFYPRDAATYQARLDGARAYVNLGQPDRAEQMLRENLIGATLTPRSPEWRDSLFELGRLLHDSQRWDEAINSLEEAVARYGGDPRAQQDVKVAKYLIAESYRHAAEQPLADLKEARAVNEREKARQLVERYLGEAVRHYDDVQRVITLHGETTGLDRAMIRNCYMLSGSALFDLGRYEEAVRVLSSVSSKYQNDPFVLEVMLQISYCWRRLGDAPKARGAIEQALQVLERLPPETDFLALTSHSSAEWSALLTDMRQW